MMSPKGGLDRYTTYMLSLYPKLNYIYNPIYGIDNKFYLFAFTDSEVLVFDAVGNELERHSLTFHMLKTWNGKVVLDKRWKKKMMADEARKEFYTFFVDDGLYTIMHIDMETGLASSVIDLRGYPFAESLHVHDGMLYFLYPTGNNHRRALYRVKLE